MSATRAVVTGGSGFIGGHLVERLLRRGDEVTTFDAGPLPAHRRRDWEQVRHVQGDIRDLDRLAEAIRPGVDVVYHLAAVVGVDQYLARPLDVIDINFGGTRNVLELAARAGARVVVASTSEVFGKNPVVPWTEDGDRVLGPTSVDRWTYSSAKALTEHLTYAFGRQHGLPVTIVRYFNAYGPGQRPAYIVSRNVHRALNGRPVVTYDQGRQTRCFTYVGDAVEGTLLAAASPEAVGESFNLGSMTETAVGDAIALIAKLAEADVETLAVDTRETYGASYEDLTRRVPDNAKARRVLGWEPATSLQDGLVRTIEWSRANPWWLALPDSGAS
ncbi:UDP-glucose 4-epimerase [Sphaerisporangium siamense]|uniref:UDP-glucose 4-epimerase n=1 Tax=Sphaerisporangium siamense TaxID=795645 RepID=A0A7W7DBN4_9ACTN|nr:NAD-dependent epimerase/dehydratase family protein [Sphaerisporangium siamense]MBB4702423.1 UDP-glucose 4-epimerase [Sphaerisporangium siamense]GII88942.1 UDP-glucose 4-epimerase [Sphaerisporangium siamense]